MIKKKVSLPIVITALLLSAAIAFSVAYVIATSSMNAKLRDTAQKQALFTTLSKVDEYVREKYQGEIDEEKLSKELCRAYAEVFDGKVLYLTSEEYKESVYFSVPDYTVLVLADGSAVVVLNDSVYEDATDVSSAQDTTN